MVNLNLPLLGEVWSGGGFLSLCQGEVSQDSIGGTGERRVGHTTTRFVVNFLATGAAGE